MIFFLNNKNIVLKYDGKTSELLPSPSRYLQFSIRVGSESETGDCAMADEEDELVLLQYSCSGNVKWKTLRLLTPIDFSEPQYVMLLNCLFRPQHVICLNESPV